MKTNLKTIIQTDKRGEDVCKRQNACEHKQLHFPFLFFFDQPK